MSSSTCLTSNSFSGLKCSGMNCTTSKKALSLTAASGANQLRKVAFLSGLPSQSVTASLSSSNSTLLLLSHLALMKQWFVAPSRSPMMSLAASANVRVTVFWDLTCAVSGGWRVYDSGVNQQCCKVIYSSNDCVGKCKSIDGLHNH